MNVINVFKSLVVNSVKMDRNLESFRYTGSTNVGMGYLQQQFHSKCLQPFAGRNLHRYR